MCRSVRLCDQRSHADSEHDTGLVAFDAGGRGQEGPRGPRYLVDSEL